MRFGASDTETLTPNPPPDTTIPRVPTAPHPGGSALAPLRMLYSPRAAPGSVVTDCGTVTGPVWGAYLLSTRNTVGFGGVPSDEIARLASHAHNRSGTRTSRQFRGRSRCPWLTSSAAAMGCTEHTVNGFCTRDGATFLSVLTTCWLSFLMPCERHTSQSSEICGCSRRRVDRLGSERR